VTGHVHGWCGLKIARSCSVLQALQAWHMTVVALVLVGGVYINLIPLDYPWPNV
jgi:hypothetical protein